MPVTQASRKSELTALRLLRSGRSRFTATSRRSAGCCAMFTMPMPPVPTTGPSTISSGSKAAVAACGAAICGAAGATLTDAPSVSGTPSMVDVSCGSSSPASTIVPLWLADRRRGSSPIRL
ncbi:hypothetical protein D3C83_33500 [compost metagenome]